MGGSEQEEYQKTLAHQMYGVPVEKLNRKQRRHIVKMQAKAA